MMTEKQLMNMQQLIKAADCNRLTVEELEDLQQTIEIELYAQRIKDFKQHMDASLPTSANNTPELQAKFDEAMEQFYSTDWVITFGNKSVTIHNEATIYNGILDTLNELIDNSL